jgi:hypothetical protein
VRNGNPGWGLVLKKIKRLEKKKKNDKPEDAEVFAKKNYRP